VPEREIFVSEFFASSKPFWAGDFRGKEIFVSVWAGHEIWPFQFKAYADCALKCF
jgi:hypothetical protein